MPSEKFGSKGEWWVVAQFILVPALLIAAAAIHSGPAWPPAVQALAAVLAGVFFVAAAALGFGGLRNLGRNLTANPRPLDDGALVQTGAYAVVRHPIYACVIFGVLGWGLAFNSLLGLFSALVVFVFFDQKSRREESWLAEKYADYTAYRARVRKLIPFIY